MDTDADGDADMDADGDLEGDFPYDEDKFIQGFNVRSCSESPVGLAILIHQSQGRLSDIR